MTANNPNALGQIPSDGIKVRDCHDCHGSGYPCVHTLTQGRGENLNAARRCATCNGTGQIVDASAEPGCVSP